MPGFVLTLVLVCAAAPGAEPAAKPGTSEAPVVAATVAGEPIYAHEVARVVEKAAGTRKIAPEALTVLQAQALAELIDRRLLLAYARRAGDCPSEAEIDAALAELQSTLARQGKSLAEFAKGQGVSMSELRRQVVWNLVWERYLAKYLTVSRMERYYAEHRRELDGTQVAVSHLLLRPPSENGRRSTGDLLRRARQLREAIQSGELSFAEAARRHSAGPSAKDGGKLGLIPRHGVMDEAFSRAAFALEVGQVSQPVRTPFGVHLIRCDGIEPGAKALAEVRDQVAEALGRELLEKLARIERDRTPVEFTGKLPYFKAGTRDLAAP